MRDNKLGYTTWAEPENYLGINWEPEGKHHPRNMMPEPYREIGRDEFDAVLHLGPYGVRGMDFKQVHVPDWPYVTNAHFYLFQRECVCVTVMHVCGSEDPDLPGVRLTDRLGQEFLLRYWRIGCTHPNVVTESPYMFEHRTTCLDCGWTIMVDSSG